MSAGYILAAADITAAVDVSAVEFVAVAVAEDTLAVAEDTPVVATVVTGRGRIKRKERGEGVDQSGWIVKAKSIRKRRFFHRQPWLGIVGHWSLGSGLQSIAPKKQSRITSR